MSRIGNRTSVVRLDRWQLGAGRRHGQNPWSPLAKALGECLNTLNGRYLDRAFDRAYPQAGITDRKKLDLVLWQTR